MWGPIWRRKWETGLPFASGKDATVEVTTLGRVVVRSWPILSCCNFCRTTAMRIAAVFYGLVGLGRGPADLISFQKTRIPTPICHLDAPGQWHRSSAIDSLLLYKGLGDFIQSIVCWKIMTILSSTHRISLLISIVEQVTLMLFHGVTAIRFFILCQVVKHFKFFFYSIVLTMIFFTFYASDCFKIFLEGGHSIRR